MRTLNNRLKGPPVGPVGIDWGHPRAEGLRIFAPLSGAHDLRELVREQRGSRTGLETYYPTQGQLNGLLFGASSYADFPEKPAGITDSSAFTVAWTQHNVNPSSYGTAFEIQLGTVGLSGTFICYQAVSDGTYYFVIGRRGSSCPSFSAAIGPPVDGVINRFLATFPSGLSGGVSTVTLWRDGVSYTTSTTAALGDSTADIFRIGARDGGSDPLEAVITDFRMWDRTLPTADAEAESTIASSWELYAEPRIWVPVSSGGGTTINAGIGNAVAAGSQATISAGRTIAAGVGAAVAAGRQASISAGTTVNAGKGNAVAQGLQASIQSGGYIAAGVGNAVAAGRAAGISAGTTISAGVGTAQAIGWRATITNQQTYSVAYGDLSHGQKKRRKKLRKVAVALEPAPAPAPRPLAPLVIREEEILRKGPAPAPQAPRREPPPVQAEPTIADVLTELRALRAELADDRKLRRSNERARMFLL